MAENWAKVPLAGCAHQFGWTICLLSFAAGGCASPADSRPPLDSWHSREPLEQSANAAEVFSKVDRSVSSQVQAAGYTTGVVVPAQELAPTQGDRGEAAAEGQTGQRQSTGNMHGSVAERASAAPMAGAEPSPVAPQNVDYFVNIALGQHPNIRAARQRVGAAYNVIPQATALPDPMLNNTFWPLEDQALQTAGGRMAHQFGLQQGVPWPEKLRTKGSIASQEVQMAQAEVERVEREVTEAVRLAYYELWYAMRAIEITQETQTLVKDLTQVAEARYRSGGTQQDVLRAQLEADRLDDQLVTLLKQKEFAQADLAALVQQPVSLLPETTKELGLVNVPEQLERLLELAEQCSPDLRMIASEIRRDRQRQKLACLQKYPDITLGLNYGIISDSGNVTSRVADGHDNISFSVGVTLPVWQDKIIGGINEAAYRIGSSVQRLQAERDVLYGKLRRLMAQADALTEQRDIYEQRIIPRAEDTLKLSIADYRGKRVDFFTLIETYRELLVYESQLARINATLAGTVAQIERAVGCPAGR